MRPCCISDIAADATSSPASRASFLTTSHTVSTGTISVSTDSITGANKSARSVSAKYSSQHDLCGARPRFAALGRRGQGQRSGSGSTVVEMPRAMPRNAEGGFKGSRRKPPLNPTTMSFAPGSSFMRLAHIQRNDDLELG